MNFIKRAILSIKERKIKTAVIFIIFMIISNLILAGFSIRTATEKASELARQKLGSEVTLQVNLEKLMQTQSRDFDPLTEQDANKLTELPHVQAYNYQTSAPAAADGFKPFEVNSGQGQQQNGGNVMIKGGMEGVEPDISISGVLYSDLLPDFNDGTSKIIDGKAIDKEDADKAVALIEKNLAEENKIKVGSKIKVKSVMKDAVEKLTVVGIYETTNADMGMNMKFTHPYNKIYVPFKEAAKLKMGDRADSVDSAVYYLDDPKNIEDFKEQAKKTGIDWETFKLDANDSAYKQMIGPIENVASFSHTIVYIVAIAGAAILGLIVMLSIKERRYEMGVLLSIGERKRKLIGQFVAEILFIGVLAFGLSIFTGNTISQKIGDNLLQKEVDVSEQQQVEQPRRMIVMGAATLNNVQVDPIDEIDVSVTSDDLQKLGLVGLLIAILATIIPSASILRLHPKTILTKNE
ncbi:ABC transporter permease [Heyndrickxia sp. NPDC080065]|uniref:ABC transporter permease n=1 Tax=Heyndrickxia sp. NPDC080065 TaxID=3390568 RepID=UPI003CFFB862